MLREPSSLEPEANIKRVSGLYRDLINQTAISKQPRENKEALTITKVIISGLF